ncbi:alpha/beta fold hydrolase [Legionella steigerwaltii]|uniref:alpha/beta fold hydrolase n=1 Tax=Legionella steigerwaltii TaxID=460 RepID=UPI00138F993F|nr:alpha/beta fold hydrolase [Legionella steigerwaltii]
MYYEQTGSGPDLVFISGLSVDHTMWDLKYFTNDFRVLTFDNRGVGQTDTPDAPYSMEGFMKDTVSLCQTLGIKKAHFVGHSMGGHIVQYIAATYPELVDKAIIACSEHEFSIISYLATKLQIDLRQYHVPKKILIENYLPVLFSIDYLNLSENRDKFIQTTLNNPYPQTDKGYIAQVEAIRKHNTINLLPKIKSPTLVIGCDQDLLTPHENSIFLQNHIPGAKLITIKNCGHAPFIEKPDEFFNLILSFLKNK